MKRLVQAANPGKGDAMTLNAARLIVNGQFSWLEIQTEPEGRWMATVQTKPAILAQGFVTMDDEGDGGEFTLLTDPRDEESDPITVEGVAWCPQAAALLMAGFAERKTGPVPVPTEEQAEATMKAFVASHEF